MEAQGKARRRLVGEGGEEASTRAESKGYHIRWHCLSKAADAAVAQGIGEHLVDPGEGGIYQAETMRAHRH